MKNHIYKIIVPALAVLAMMGCSSPSTPSFVEDTYTISIQPNLPTDKDGYSVLTLSRVDYQTLHRLQGELVGTKPLEVEQKIFWESSHIWWFKPGDTAVTIIRRNVNDQGQWVNVDTLYWDTPDSLSVPTINPTSYTTMDGKFSGMIAPTIDMLGDTMTVKCRWYSKWYDSDTIDTFIKICLE